MDSTRSKIIFPIKSLVIRELLEVPLSFTLNHEYFVEENLIEQFRHAVVEEKQVVYSKILKPDVFVAYEPFPFDINLFNEESQLFLSPLSHFLGLGSDRFVLGVLLSLLFRLNLHQLESDFNRSCFLKLDEFLELENIHSQLVNLHITKHFKFQSYFVSMFFFFNEENLQFLEIVFTSKIRNNTSII